MKKQTTVFDKYYSRLAKEGLLKALIWGAVVGFSALFICSVVLYFTKPSLYWIGFIVLVAATAIATVIFYFKAFRPDAKAIAKRIDELGLEERMITMHELKDDDSLMARLQRKDAEKAIQSFDASLVKIVISLPLIIALAAVGVAGSGMVTVSALSASGVIKSGDQITEEAFTPDPVFYEISYVAEGGGRIVGEENQLVEAGQDGSAVQAVPDDGWMFVQWSEDSLQIDVRSEFGVEGNMTFTAIFEEIGEGEGEEGEGGEGEEGGEEGDDAGDKPDGGGGGSSDNEQGGNDFGGGGESDPGSGNVQDYNQYKDGGTYYGDDYDAAYEDAKNEMESNGNIEGNKDVANEYFESLK